MKMVTMNRYELLPSSSFGFICRTCLLHNEVFLIDEVSWEGINLKEIILNWTSLEVNEYEQLPQQMCTNCIKHMYQTHRFLSTCKRSEWTLKGILLREELEAENDLEQNTTLNPIFISVGKEETNIEGTKKRSNCIDKSLAESDTMDNSITDSDRDNSLPDFENVDINQPTVDTNCSVTSADYNRAKVKTEISYKEEISVEHEPEETILHEIQSIKSDITKIRARNQVRLRQKMKARLLSHKFLPKNNKKTRNKGTPYKCMTCEASFQTREALQVHRNETHKKFYKFHCQFCESKYQSISQLEAHIRIHTGEKPYQCVTCGDCFSFKSVLQRHMVRHMQIKPYRCRYCDKEFTRKHILDQHERKHTGKRLLCRYCGQEFQTPKILIHHEKNSHPAPQNVPTSMTENGFQCDMCGKVLQSEKTLNAHVLLHGPRNFVCETCGKGFTTNERLLLHMKMTHESTMFSCHLCANKYRQKSGLIGHLESQHESNQYDCVECGKKFVYKGSLRQHMRIHTGDPKYQCTECHQICVNRRRLEAHMRTHSGEKPFACETCGKCFAEKANFHNHQKIHTRDKSYVCNVCEKIFIDFRSLKRHIKQH